MASRKELLATITPDMRLTRAFFLKVYGYELTWPGFAENVLTRMGYTTDQAIKIAIMFELREISDSLGSPEYGDMALSLSRLSDCVSYIPPTPHQQKGRHVLQISGMVDTNCY